MVGWAEPLEEAKRLVGLEKGIRDACVLSIRRLTRSEAERVYRKKWKASEQHFRRHRDAKQKVTLAKVKWLDEDR